MNRRYLSSSLIVATLLCFFASDFFASNAAAQDRRADGVYLRGRVGVSSYSGDRDGNPDNEIGELFEEQGDFPSLGLELGYAGSLGALRGGLALTYIGATYSEINNPALNAPAQGVPALDDDTDGWRHTVGLVGQLGFAPQAVINPYIRLGAGASFGSVDVAQGAGDLDSGSGQSVMSISPIGGLGVDIAIADRVGLFFEATGIMNLPDNEDGIDASAGIDSDHEDFDMLGSFGGGLRFTFRSPFTPVEVIALDGPEELTAGESGTFTATVNDEEATRPLEYQWDFGDGNTADGLLANHTFEEEGSYTVTFTASSEANADSSSMNVQVNPPPVPAEIVSVNANPNPAEEDETVQFNAELQGDEPVNCEWDFGDGNTSSDCEPSHTYDEQGTYTATLSVSNEHGEDTRSVTMTIEPALPAICMEVTELNSAYFGLNSSTLSDEATEALDENIDILTQCPNLSVRVEGYAAPGERDAQGLSEDRARAVEEYYTDNGVEAGQLMTEGLGAEGGQTAKKGGGEQFRRVDSIPGESEMMDM